MAKVLPELPQIRRRLKPPRSHWWWFLDKLAEKRGGSFAAQKCRSDSVFEFSPSVNQLSNCFGWKEANESVNYARKETYGDGEGDGDGLRLPLAEPIAQVGQQGKDKPNRPTDC
jgi:hypothetical protein